MAGLQKAIEEGHVGAGEVGILDSTAHMLKFAGFQEMYFDNSFASEFDIRPKSELQNQSIQLRPKNLSKYPSPGQPLLGEEQKNYLREMAVEVARVLNLKKK